MKKSKANAQKSKHKKKKSIYIEAIALGFSNGEISIIKCEGFKRFSFKDAPLFRIGGFCPYRVSIELNSDFENHAFLIGKKVSLSERLKEGDISDITYHYTDKSGKQFFLIKEAYAQNEYQHTRITPEGTLEIIIDEDFEGWK